MAETEQDDEKRRQRARFVDALATSAQQPGERSRVGTRVAGATAILALAAGATLGLGAWRAYQSAEDEKEQQIAAERVAAEKKLTQAPTSSAEEREKEREKQREKEEEKRKKEAQEAAAAALAAKPPPPSPSPEETAEDTNSLKNSRIEAPPLRTKVLLKNMATNLCADLPGYGPGRVGKIINQHRCDGTDKDNQLWNVRVHYEDEGPGGAPLAAISNVKDNLCMDVPTRGPQPAGTPLSQARCISNIDEDNQLWWFEEARDGTYKIRNYASNHQCLRVGQAPPDGNDRRLILERCTDGPESNWRLLR